MKKNILFLVLFVFFFSCEKETAPFIGVNDLVNADLPFEVTFVPCADLDDDACDQIPIFEATISISKINTGSNELQFVAEKKTDRDGRLNFVLVPLGNYEAHVSTNEYGDTTVQAVSFSGRSKTWEQLH